MYNAGKMAICVSDISSGKKLKKKRFHSLSGLLSQVTPVTTHDVQALQLLRSVVGTVRVLCHAQGSILLFLQQQHGLEHAINVYLQQTVQLVHLRLYL